MKVFFHDSANQEKFRQMMAAMEENYQEPAPPNIQLMVGDDR